MVATIEDAAVRRSVKLLYAGSGVLFGATIFLGILQVFMDEISHAQVLTHLHSGTIGWITLSVIASAMWIYTAGIETTKATGTITRVIAIVGFLSVLGYIFSFALAFSEQGDYFRLLPIFGVPTGLVILAALGFVASKVGKQPVLTSAHIMLLGALIVASLGAVMGILWGLTFSTDFFPYGDNDFADGLGAHAGPMDMYLLLAFAGIVEFLLRGDAQVPRSKPAIAQVSLGVVSAFAVAVGLFIGIEPLAPVSLLLFLIAFGFYFGRIGWRVFKIRLSEGGSTPGLYFGALFIPFYVITFVTIVFTYFIPDEPLPHALGIFFLHVTFVGMSTNLILAMQATFVPEPRSDKALAIGFWLLNFGFLAFVLGEFLADRKEGALLMAAGVVMTLVTVWARFIRNPSSGPAPMATLEPEEAS